MASEKVKELVIHWRERRKPSSWDQFRDQNSHTDFDKSTLTTDKWRKCSNKRFFQLKIIYLILVALQFVTMKYLSELKRFRDPKSLKILYFDHASPNPSMGSGFGRSFDNLSMIADLGYYVTLITLSPLDSTDWCNKKCVDDITGLGIKYVTNSTWEEFIDDCIRDYDIVIISRPDVYNSTYKKWQELNRTSHFSLIYDTEALQHRRDMMALEISQRQNISFPGFKIHKKPQLQRSIIQAKGREEIDLIKMADSVIAVSEEEKKYVEQSLSSSSLTVDVIGHIMETGKTSQKKFSDRFGILFLASFNTGMYYNGDAIWYFLKYIYPLVIKESISSKPLNLTIAGRHIPDEIRKFVEVNEGIAKYVDFLESPPTIDHLFEKNRIFIAPHLYGAGIQYKVSKALASGLPVVMSESTKLNFGDIPGCVGLDEISFANCIIDLHGNESQWEAVRDEGIAYIRRTHNRQKIMDQWSEIIERSLKKKRIKTYP